MFCGQRLGRKHEDRCRYYTFQFHLEEIVDATEQLQAMLCDLIGAMPRNCNHPTCPHTSRM